MSLACLNPQPHDGDTLVFKTYIQHLKTGKCQGKITEKSGILKLRLSGNPAVGYGQNLLDIAPNFNKIVPDIRF